MPAQEKIMPAMTGPLENAFNVYRQPVGMLPPELELAQEAIRLPEVQAMLRRLADFNLGIYMVHMHDEDTGAFQVLPDNVTQVETGSGVSFLTDEQMADHTDGFVPVGWVWRAGKDDEGAKCTAKCVKGPGGTHDHTHK